MKISYLLSISIYILVLFNILIISTKSCFAATESKIAFDIKPSIFETKILNGQQKIISFEISNYSKEKLDLQASLLSFSLDNNSKPLLSSLPSNLTKIITLESKYSPWTIQLEPNEIKEITPIIKMPKELKTGDYYFALIFTAISPKLKPVKINHYLEVGALVFVTNGANTPEKITASKLSITNFTLFNHLVFSNSINFNLNIKNQGRFKTKLNSTVEIKQILGKSTSIVKPNPFTLLSESVKVISEKDGLKYSLSNYPEIYLAKLQISDYYNEKTIYTSSYWFIHLPYWTLIVLVLLGLAYLVNKLFQKSSVNNN